MGPDSNPANQPNVDGSTAEEVVLDTVTDEETPITETADADAPTPVADADAEEVDAEEEEEAVI